jgi:hypothetical protein
VRVICNPVLVPYLGTVFKQKKFEKYVQELSWKKDINAQFARALKNAGICIYYRFNPCARDLQPFSWAGFEVHVKYTYVLPLTNLDVVWKNMASSRRSEIRKAEREIDSIRLGDFGSYLELSREIWRRQGYGETLGIAWQALYDAARSRKCCEVFTAYKNSDAIASFFLLWDARRGYHFGSGTRKGTVRGASSYLIWESLKYLKEKTGVPEFDFEGSEVPEIEFYFRRFGGELRAVYDVAERTLRARILQRLRLAKTTGVR